MRHPWANTLLLLLVLAEAVSGFFGLVSGSADEAVFILAHRAVGWSILVLLAWKGRNIIGSFRWRKPMAPRGASIVLFAALALTLGLGFAWSAFGPFRFGLFSGVSWHIYVGASLAPVMLWHAVYQTPGWSWRSLGRLLAPLKAVGAVSAVGRPERGEWDFGRRRRSFLRMAGIALLGVAAWQVIELAARLMELSGSTRRFTGSYETGSFAGNAFPFTSWINDRPAPVDTSTWRLTVRGAVERELEIGYEELSADAETVATIDCTGGWHSRQVWRGVPVAQLLDMATPVLGASSVTFTSVTGYYRRFSMGEARDYMLATHVGDEPLAHGHGAPLRLVAPDKRGFEWVKWVRTIEVNTGPKWLQPPLPTQ